MVRVLLVLACAAAMATEQLPRPDAAGAGEPTPTLVTPAAEVSPTFELPAPTPTPQDEAPELAPAPPTPAATEPAPAPPAPATQTASEAATHPESWRALLTASSAAATDLSRVSLTASVSAEVYLHPLLNDPDVPLGQLAFLQHPSIVGVSVGSTATGGTATTSATLFPWRETGFLAQVTGEFDPATPRVLASWVAELQHYLSPQTRLAVAYVGNALWVPPAPSLDVELSSTFHAGFVALTTIVGRFMFDVSGELGPVRVAMSQAVFGSVSGQATYFFGRRISASLGASASAQTYGAVGTITRESGSVSGQLYLTDSVYLAATWSVGFRQVPGTFVTLPGTPFESTAAVLHDISLTAGLRL